MNTRYAAMAFASATGTSVRSRTSPHTVNCPVRMKPIAAKGSAMKAISRRVGHEKVPVVHEHIDTTRLETTNLSQHKRVVGPNGVVKFNKCCRVICGPDTIERDEKYGEGRNKNDQSCMPSKEAGRFLLGVLFCGNCSKTDRPQRNRFVHLWQPGTTQSQRMHYLKLRDCHTVLAIRTILFPRCLTRVKSLLFNGNINNTAIELQSKLFGLK